MESKKVLFFNKLSFVTLFATLFGSLFFFIPYMPVTLEASKGFLMSVGLTMSLFFWLVARLGEGKFTIPRDRLILFAGVIPLVFFVASLFSSSLYISLFGRGFEIGTFGSMLTMFILFFLSTMYFQTEKRLWYFFGGLFLGSLLLAVFQLFYVFIGFGKLPGLLQGISSGNLFGSWNDFGLFFGLVVLLSLFTLEFLRTKGIFKIVQYFLIVVGLVFLIILNIPFVWLLVGLFSMILTVYSISLQKAGISMSSEPNDKRKFPFASLIVLFIALIFLVGSNSLGSLISRYVSVSNVDVRPSVSATAQVAYKAIRHNPFFGTGPNTFAIDWAAWQPKGIAETIYWNVDFSNGFGLIPSFVVTTGLLGIASFLLFMVVFLIRGVQSLRVAMQGALSNYFIVTMFMMSIYTWLTLIFYTPNIVMIALAFASSGALISILVYKKVMPVAHFSFLSDPRNSFFSILGLIVLMIATLSTTYIYSEKFASVIYFSKALANDNTMESLVKSESMLSNAISLDKNDIYYRTLSQVYIAQIGLIITDKTLSSDTLKSSVQQLVNASSQSAGLAVAQNPKQYLNYMNLGNVYSALVPLSVVNSYKSAVVAYEKAHELAPNNPSILLARASLEVANKTKAEARKFIEQALALKPDYTDAIFLLAQIEIDEGNIAEAIKQAEYASSVAPNDPTVFFKLGLLRYSNSNFAGSVSAFERAVILDPSYLNARYFLGQSYKKVGRTSDALIQFKILTKIVPDNQDIKDEINSFSDTVPSDTTPALETSSTVKTPLESTQ
ncbi:tetratricopeptide repeat protein [Candidatus Nomurabacteria bacterium]|nr:tetratricopeptide repeat protein [Candidatus Nomurabacteria bacterium]